MIESGRTTTSVWEAQDLEFGNVPEELGGTLLRVWECIRFWEGFNERMGGIRYASQEIKLHSRLGMLVNLFYLALKVRLEMHPLLNFIS